MSKGTRGFGRQHILTSSPLSLVASVWPDCGLGPDSFDEQVYSELIHYFEDARTLLARQPRRFVVNTLEDTVDLSQHLKRNAGEPFSNIIQSYSKALLNVDEKAIRRSFELCIRVWLTINVNSSSIAVGSVSPHETTLEWPLSSSLQDIIRSRFVRSYPAGQKEQSRSRIPATFTAAYLVNVCGMKLYWTDTLTDHLKQDERSLVIYKHKICLLNHLKSKDGCPLPTDLLEETLDTLNLLFPFGDTATKQLLAREGQQVFYQLGNCGRNRELDLSRYAYWQEELEDLMGAFRSPARSWRQLATDRRNLMEWAAFWVAFMVAILTLVSIPCNIIQATYSVKAYYATLPQNNVSPQA